MTTVDTRGELCPTPLIMTKKLLNAAAAGEPFEVLVDNEMSCQNLASYLRELKIEFTTRHEGSLSVLRFVKPQAKLAPVNETAFCHTSTGYAVAITGETMGRGADELGTMLMRAFVNSLKEAERLPSVIVLYNGGVKLAEQGRDTALALAELEAAGVGIVACGTCVDYYGLKERMAVGAIGNMFKITQLLSEAGHVVYP